MPGDSARENGKLGGRPRGPTRNTLDKIAAREYVRNRVMDELDPLLEAQFDNAKGISHFMLRDPETGQFKRLTDPAEIVAALNAPGAGEGSTYYIYAKDPSIQAFTDLMNRALDKPKEQKQEVEITGEPELIAALMGGRQRAAKAKEGK